MYTLELDEETTENFLVEFLKRDYKKLFLEEQSAGFEDKHPEDQDVTHRTVDGLIAVLNYYMVPSEADKFFQDVAEGKEEETISVHLDDEIHQKLLEASLYSAVNNYFQEQKDAFKSHTHLGNTES